MFYLPTSINSNESFEANIARLRPIEGYLASKMLLKYFAQIIDHVHFDKTNFTGTKNAKNRMESSTSPVFSSDASLSP